MTFDGRDGHIQRCGDFRGIEVFLIAEDHDHARRFRQRSDQPLEDIREERVASGGDGGGFGDIGKGNLGTAIAAAGFIDGALDGHFAEPVGGVLGALDGGEVPVEGKEDILGDLVGERAVVEEVPADTEDHGLVAVHQGGEIESGLRRVLQSSHGRQLRKALHGLY